MAFIDTYKLFADMRHMMIKNSIRPIHTEIGDFWILLQTPPTISDWLIILSRETTWADQNKFLEELKKEPVTIWDNMEDGDGNSLVEVSYPFKDVAFVCCGIAVVCTHEVF